MLYIQYQLFHKQCHVSIFKISYSIFNISYYISYIIYFISAPITSISDILCLVSAIVHSISVIIFHLYSIYKGESGWNGHSRGLEHQHDLRCRREKGPLQKHCIQEHSSQEPECTMELVSHHKFFLDRQVHELVKISETETEIVLNSKSVLHQVPVVRAIVYSISAVPYSIYGILCSITAILYSISAIVHSISAILRPRI